MGIYIPNMSKPKECGHCDMFIEHNSIYHCYLTGSHIAFVGEVADDCPLIEIDLVKCGECKWWNRDGKRKDGKGWCENAICGLTKPNAFCSYGERK